jgi:hypothetical protein
VQPLSWFGCDEVIYDDLPELWILPRVVASCCKISSFLGFAFRGWEAMRSLPSSDLFSEDEYSFYLDSADPWQSTTTFRNYGYCLESSQQAKCALSSLDLLSQDVCSLCLDSDVARQSLTNIPSFGYGLDSSHQAKRALPSLDFLSQDECSLFLDSVVTR